MNKILIFSREALLQTSIEGLEAYIDELQNDIDNFDNEYLQQLQATRDTAAEILEMKTTQTEEIKMPYKVLTLSRVRTLSPQELQKEIDELAAELKIFSAERYDAMCESLADMRQEQEKRIPSTEDHYLVVEPRFRSAANTIYGPATLEAAQYLMIQIAQGDDFAFEEDHQGEVNLEDNYAVDTQSYCMEINKLTPMPPEGE